MNAYMLRIMEFFLSITWYQILLLKWEPSHALGDAVCGHQNVQNTYTSRPLCVCVWLGVLHGFTMFSLAAGYIWDWDGLSLYIKHPKNG